jgi:thiamine-phosphate pyrophosphorylase
VTTLKPLDHCRLYAFVDTAYLAGRGEEEVATQLCEGGADLIQLRAKDRTESEVRRLACALRPVVEAAGVWLVINDYPEIAQAAGAPLCHLGQEDFVRRTAPLPAVPFGLSTHAPAQAAQAVAVGAAYVGVGPVFATPTKPGRPPVTLEYVRWAAAHLALPWFAIGGITLENLDSVLAAGARRVCVVSAILRCQDIRATCRDFKTRLLAAAP